MIRIRRGRHDEELARDFHVQRLEGAEVGQVLLGDSGDGDVPDLDPLLLHQMEQEIEGTGEDLEIDRVALELAVSIPE